jgi:nucleoside phosphorylase
MFGPKKMGAAPLMLDRFNRRVSDALFETTSERLAVEVERRSSDIRIGIITALQKETDALLQVAKQLGTLRIPEPRAALDSTAFYYPIEFRDRGDDRTTIKAVICQCSEMGNNSAAIAATCILKDYPIVQNLVMVGIAGGVPASPKEIDRIGFGAEIADHVRLGDVVISKDGVYQYDLVKRNMGKVWTVRAVKKSIAPDLKFLCERAEAEIQSFEDRIQSLCTTVTLAPRPPDITDLLQEFVYEDGFDEPIAIRSIFHPKQTNRRPGQPMVHFGEIGSANILLKDPKLRDSLREERSIRAIEMEGSGVADAAWSFRRGCIVVRGICDYCDPNKNDDWQNYAAGAAAAALGEFVMLMLMATREKRYDL